MGSRCASILSPGGSHDVCRFGNVGGSILTALASGMQLALGRHASQSSQEIVVIIDGLMLVLMVFVLGFRLVMSVSFV
jgi:hypothetical protein